MSADMTSQEDLDDVAFRALLAPLALEVLPGRSVPPRPEPAKPAPLESGTSPEGQSPPVVIPPGLDAPGLDAPGVDAVASVFRSEARPPVTEVAVDPAAPTSAAAADAQSPSQYASSARLAMPEHGPGQFAAVPGHRVWSAPNVALEDGLTPASAASGPELLPEVGALPEAALPPEPTSAASDVRPKDRTPPAIAPAHPAVPASERLSEDWWAPPSAPLDLPDVPSPEGQEEHRTPPAAGQFTSLPSGVFPEGKWRLTVALPDQLARLQPPPAGALARRTLSPAHPTFSTSELGPYRSSVTRAAGATRPTGGPRLIARAGAAQTAVALPNGATQLVMRRPALPPARVRWSVVLLAGLASAVSVACLSWLFEPTVALEVPKKMDGAVQSNLGYSVPAAMPNAAPALTSGAPQAASQGATRAPMSAAPSATSPQAMIGLLTQRGDTALAVGDIIAARLLYERAATMGSATAATAAGKTYDLDFLLRADTHGIRPDSAAAATWYRKAVALGDSSARTLLARLEAQSRP